MSFRRVVVGALLVVSILGGRTNAQSQTADRAKYGGRLLYGALKDITTTNPFLNIFSTDYDIRGLVFEGLTGMDREGNVVPGLARSWEISKDGLAYTFSLRKGLKFHNGKPVTSEDVKWSLDYTRDPKNRAYYFDQFTGVESVDQLDPLTVVVRLKRPFSPLVAVVATARSPILPAGTQISPTAFPPGTGPFQFVEWQSGNHLTLKAFKEYWVPGLPHLSEVIFKPITDDSVRVTALKAKEIDIAEELPYQVVADASKTKPEFQIVPFEAGVRRRINFNTRMPPFSDVRVRQAVAFAIDKKELAAGQTWGFAKPTNQRYPAGSKWFIDLKDRDQDLQKARSLLAEAGYKDGLQFKVPVYPGPDMELNVLLKDQLRKVGIDAELVTMDWGAHTKVRRERQYTMYAAGMGGRPEPDQVYYADLHSKSTNNNSGYSNPEVDQWLERARTVVDLKERKRLYADVLKLAQRDVPEIYVYMGPKFLGVRPNVKGFATGTLEELFTFAGGGMAYTWIEQ